MSAVVNAQSVEVTDELESLTYPSDEELAAMANDPSTSSIMGRLDDGNF